MQLCIWRGGGTDCGPNDDNPDNIVIAQAQARAWRDARSAPFSTDGDAGTHTLMTRALRIVLVVLAGLALAGPAWSEIWSQGRGEPSRTSFKHEPMIFFVAEGDPDSCGPGCSRWIAAYGTFDPKAHLRLAAFLTPERENLPIYFHSPGGELQPSLAVGNLLREKRMTAGIGQTLVQGCRDRRRADAACRKRMASANPGKARLRTATGICASGCAYALIGATERLIAPGARFGVHANRVILRPEHAGENRKASAAAGRAAERDSYDLLRHYVTLAGIDPALIDLAIRTPHDRVYWLSREELARYGLLPADFFETGWLRHVKPDGSTFIIKSMTEAASAFQALPRTTNIAINCSARDRPTVTLRRELRNGEDALPRLRMSSGPDFVLDFRPAGRTADAADMRMQPVPSDALARAAGSNGIVLREESEAGTREFRLSTQGLSEALRMPPSRCFGA